MPIISTAIFGFESLAISILLKNEEKYRNMLERKIISTDGENIY